MKLDSRRQEGVRHFAVQRDGAVHHRRHHFDDATVKAALLQVLSQDAAVNAVEGRGT